MRQINRSFISALLFVCLLSSCKEDIPKDPVIPNEEELITTLYLNLMPGTGQLVTLSFEDLDGAGGAAPIIKGGTLAPNTTYEGILTLFNELEDPVGDISVEIEDEALDHQFFFQTDIPGLDVSYNDQDSEGNPIGLRTIISTPDSGSSGTLTITLRHEPDKDATGVSEGDISNAGGETDIQVTFEIDVQ
ncbi:MAG: type 1 periplasmic binding fold superfamily protein [Saprospiraceae bacterium]|nr:type 1 periplasmic binding fold superfamily protein [Saprospiraceae bacterium]